MGKVTRFEDLVAWQRARAFSAKIHAVSRNRPFSRDFALCLQIRKAALSVPSNIAEGFERFNRADFLNFLRIAKASCGEVRSQLYSAFDNEYIGEESLRELLQMSMELRLLITKLRGAIIAKERSEAGTRHSGTLAPSPARRR